MNLPITSAPPSHFAWPSSATHKPISCSRLSRIKSGIQYSPLLHQFKHCNTKEKVITDHLQGMARQAQPQHKSNYFNDKNSKNNMFFLERRCRLMQGTWHLGCSHFQLRGCCQLSSQCCSFSIMKFPPWHTKPLSLPPKRMSPHPGQTSVLGHEGIPCFSTSTG